MDPKRVLSQQAEGYDRGLRGPEERKDLESSGEKRKIKRERVTVILFRRNKEICLTHTHTNAHTHTQKI